MSTLTRAKHKRVPTPARERWHQQKGRWPGLFVSFEGGEGAGKSSLIARVAEHLSLQGHALLSTREPGGTPLGEMIRQWLLNPAKDISVGAKAELCLFLAARAQHIEEMLEPALKAGKIVLCDRFNDSTVAYQGVGRGLGIEQVRQLCTLICDGVTPDITFYLDVTPEVGLDRALKSHSERILDRIESQEMTFHQRIREAFLQMARREQARFHVIDAHQTQDGVFEQVMQVIEEHLSKRGL